MVNVKLNNLAASDKKVISWWGEREGKSYENLENKSKLSHNFHGCSFVFLVSRRDEGRAGLKAMRRGNNYQLSFAQNTFLQLFHRARHHNQYLRLLRPPCRFITRHCKKTEKKPFVKELGPAKMNQLR